MYQETTDPYLCRHAFEKYWKMLNCIQNYLTDNNILYEKYFGFQKRHFSEIATFLFVDQIRNSFESNQYTLVVFVYLFKALDTVNHKTLIYKLEIYGISQKNILWVIIYLTHQTQFISYSNLDTRFQGLYVVSCEAQYLDFFYY